MSYSSYLKPRHEVISEEGVEGIVDLANLKDDSKTKLEARPRDFLTLTYPTNDLIKALEQINLRFSSDKEEHKKRFQDTYPFSPSLMDIILKKIPAQGGFQNVRGALSFLGNMVRLTHTASDIITPADASLKDKATTIMLKDLDPSGDLINRASENMDELIPKAPLSIQFASAVLLYTLTGRGSDIGASRE
jgi:predicted AAA+ superfamily ATPase